MSARVTILVTAPTIPGNPDAAAIHATYRVDALRAELAERLGHPVPVIHGTIADAPPEGVILLFCHLLDEVLADAPPGTAARVIWMLAGRTTVRDALAHHGLLGAVQHFRYYVWMKSPSQDRAAGLRVRLDVARALDASATADALMPGYVSLLDTRYRDLLSLICVCVAVANGEPPPAPDRPADPPEALVFPMGYPLILGDGGREYRVARALHGTPDRGLYLARRVSAEDETAYVTLSLRQTVHLDQKRAELALPAEGFAPLLDIVRLDHEGTAYDALLEAEPAGVPLPELIFVTLNGSFPDDPAYLPTWGPFRPKPTGLVPRCERFLATAQRPCYGFGPLFETVYQAPEILGGRSPGPAADVFSLAVILALLTSGGYPFAGDTVLARLTALMTGAWTRFDAPEALTSLLSRALSPDPAARPDLSAMRAQLEDLAA